MSSQNPHHARRWAILAVLGIAQLMVVLDATIVNIALPSAQRSLEFSDESRQWVVTAYALAFGSLLLLGGRIGDLFGRKRVFIAGLIGFAVASAIGGAAESFGVLVASRALQGVFGALLAPAALSLLTTTFTEPSERAKAFGIFGAIAGGGAAIGLLLGGVLTEYLSWRWCLYVNLLFAIPAAIAAFSLLVNQVPATSSAPGHPGHDDRDDRPVRARLRLLARRDPSLGRRPDDRPARPLPPSCSSPSWPSSAAPATRCCRCGSCSTAVAAAPTWPWASPARACSASSCS